MMAPEAEILVVVMESWAISCVCMELQTAVSACLFLHHQSQCISSSRNGDGSSNKIFSLLSLFLSLSRQMTL